MTEIVYSDDKLNDIRLDGLELPPFAKPPTDKRGYLYIVEDSAFTGFVKIGRTSDLKKRLQAYNNDRPYNSVKYTVISEKFDNVILAEAQVLEKLYEQIPPTTFKKEWFAIEHRPLLVKWIDIAEKAQDVPAS